VLFSIVPAPYNLILLFYNGQLLGIIWGLVFAYLEERRLDYATYLGGRLWIGKDKQEYKKLKVEYYAHMNLYNIHYQHDMTIIQTVKQ
jgi:hypothetical protein